MISVAISFCPNDTFSFYHLLQEPQYDLTIADLEALNEYAIDGAFDVVKISAALYPQIEKEYQVLQSGAALGFHAGPLVIAKRGIDLDGAKVALPGQYTTARFLFDRFNPNTKKSFVRYDDIIPFVKQQKVDAGVIIHESRFSYEKNGLVALQDLGKLWEEEFALPLPLGIIVAKRSLGDQKVQQIEDMLCQSIALAKQNPKLVWDFVKTHSIEKNDKIIASHISLYVNEESVRLSTLGKKALHALWELAVCKM